MILISKLVYEYGLGNLYSLLCKSRLLNKIAFKSKNVFTNVMLIV